MYRWVCFENKSLFRNVQGGLKAVVWADTIQMTVTLGSLFAVLILGTVAVGGVYETWRVSEEGGRIIFWKYERLRSYPRLETNRF